MLTSTCIPLLQAANMIGRSRPALLQAIKKGRISGVRDDVGRWYIEPAELIRAFPREYAANSNYEQLKTATDTALTQGEQAGKAANSEIIDLLKAQLADMKQERDDWKAQAQKLALTAANQEKPKGFFKRLFA